MSKYVENNLQKNETIVARAKINFLAAFPQILWAIICIAGIIILSVYFKPVLCVNWTTLDLSEYAEKFEAMETEEYQEELSKLQSLDEKDIQFLYKWCEGEDVEISDEIDLSLATAIIALDASTLRVVKNAIQIVDIVIAVIGLLPLIQILIKLAFTELAVTNKRVIGKTGVVAMKSLDLPINNVQTVGIQSTFWGRIFHFSTIVVKSASGDNDGVLWKGITNANEMKNTITAAIEKNAEEARKAQAAEIAMAMNKSSN